MRNLSTRTLASITAGLFGLKAVIQETKGIHPAKRGTLLRMMNGVQDYAGWLAGVEEAPTPASEVADAKECLDALALLKALAGEDPENIAAVFAQMVAKPLVPRLLKMVETESSPIERINK